MGLRKFPIIFRCLKVVKSFNGIIGISQRGSENYSANFKECKVRSAKK